MNIDLTVAEVVTIVALLESVGKLVGEEKQCNALAYKLRKSIGAL